MTLALRRLASRLGYSFADQSLFLQALTHRSAGADNNERLEFLGDAVLSVVIAQWLFERFPSASEGELTRLRASLVKGSTLARIAKDLDLGECLQLGGGELKSGGHRRESILADAVEALIGAIYLEAGIDACRERVLHWFGERLGAIVLGSDEKDAKTRLQEYLQSRGQPLPIYDVVCTEGDPHNQIFTIACTVPGIGEPVSARASSRKKAEKRAAEQALSLLMGA
ncbi:MAG: ribonuclease III [Porticoccaceae bacterium]|jgi:ribonuclease-3|nr:ribonuclease III [Porticoccaceae bacterium]MEA3299780.1 ribonuclease III [Pseudomonadota bacterium]HLS98925.1 ribonuclease III [Porticoccaceae bacterium]